MTIGDTTKMVTSKWCRLNGDANNDDVNNENFQPVDLTLFTKYLSTALIKLVIHNLSNSV